MSISDLKYKDESWDFRESNTKEYTHCFHTYPAMMIPQIARKLLKEYGIEEGVASRSLLWHWHVSGGGISIRYA